MDEEGTTEGLGSAKTRYGIVSLPNYDGMDCDLDTDTDGDPLCDSCIGQGSMAKGGRSIHPC